ncbi:DUF4129 domain-containing protein [Spirosoma koreense]
MKAVSKIKQLLYWLFLIGCLSGRYADVYAQQADSKKPSVAGRDDHSPLVVRYPRPEQLRDLQTDHDYQYGNDAPPPENPIARFFNWLFRKLAVFLSSQAYQNIWQYIILAVIAGLVIYLLMKAEVLGFLFPKKSRTGSLDYENLSENIHEINFDLAVQEAVDQHNFRLAVRLLYLQTIKHLTDAGRIDYKPDKTNRQYVYELKNTPYQPDFEHLTRQFEFVWYGDFPIDETQFTQLWQQFRTFNRPVTQLS